MLYLKCVSDLWFCPICLQLSARVKKTWKPQLFKRELYSEILDQKFTTTVTAHTLDLIDAAYGFDFYILKVTADYFFITLISYDFIWVTSHFEIWGIRVTNL